MNLSEKLFANGQSIWYDNVDRRLLDSGELAAMIQNKEIFGIPGADSVAYRSWGAFDSSAIMDRQTDSLIVAGENGAQYRLRSRRKDDIH